MKKLIVIKIFLLLFACASVSTAGTKVYNVINAGNSNLQYTGRIDFSNPASAKITWPGSYIKANFTGSSLGLILNDEYGNNYFDVIIDNNINKPIILDCIKGEKIYSIADNLNTNNHSLLVFKRTEGSQGCTFFNGLVLDENGTLLGPPKRPTRKIEFIGDSITSGMSNETPIGNPEGMTSERNNFLTYGAITARNLDADYTCISQSGIGIMISWFDFTMPDFFDQLDATGIHGKKWDFKKWQPDVVVINLFQNDSWLVNRLKPVPDDNQRVLAYYNFIKTVREKYPKAYIICTLGSMDATKPGSKWPGYISKAVDEFKKKNNDKRIDVLFFEYTGFSAHPRVKQHKENAEKLTKFIKTKMNW